MERTGVTRAPAGVAVIVAHKLRGCPMEEAFDTSSIDSLFGDAIAADDEEAAATTLAAIAFALADDAYADAIISSTYSADADCD